MYLHSPSGKWYALNVDPKEVNERPKHTVPTTTDYQSKCVCGQLPKTVCGRLPKLVSLGVCRQCPKADPI